MRNRFCFILMVIALAACDRVTSPSYRDAGTDSAASLWEMVDAGSVNYNGVAGSAPDNVFIVGDQGTILHWDGVSLTPEASGTTANLRGVAVVNETIAYAVGEQGTILSRQDGVWNIEAPLTTAVLNAIYIRADAVIAAGEQGTVLTLFQGTWGQVQNSRNDNYYAASASNDCVFVFGALGVITCIDYAARKVAATAAIPGYTKIIAGAFRYSTGTLLVGVDGGYFFWNSGSATRITGLPQKFLRAISVIGDTAWIVGHEGLVATGTVNASPTLVPTPDDRWLLGVYAAAPDDVWVVGRSGLIMRGPPGVRGRIDGGAP
jgi:hypothetical protein